MITNGSKKWMSSVLWAVYVAVAVLAGYHTFNVFSLSDPPFFALLGAIAVDGVLALTLMMVGRWYGDQQIAGIVGTIVFALLSGSMQVIAHKVAMHETLPSLLQWGADYAVPISVTLSMITLGLIKYFDRDRNGVPDFMQPPTPQAPQPPATITQPPTHLAIETSQHPSELSLAPVALSTDNGEKEVLKKRGPGRPPRSQAVAYASNLVSDPKVLTSSRKS